jgi:hypothetical protein
MTLGGDGNAGTMAFLGTLNKATIEKKAELDEQKAELELSQGSRPPSGSKPLSTNGSRPTSALLRDKSGGPLTTLAPLGANAEILEQFTKTQVCSQSQFCKTPVRDRQNKFTCFPSLILGYSPKNRHP